MAAAAPDVTPSKYTGKLRQSKEVYQGDVIPRPGPESAEPAVAQDFLRKASKGTSKTFRHQPETAQTFSVALEALGDHCRTIESGPQNHVEAEPADTAARRSETLQQFEEQPKIPLIIPSEPPSVPLGELSPAHATMLPGTGQASG